MNQSINKEVLENLIKQEKQKKKFLLDVTIIIALFIIIFVLLKVIFGIAIVEGNSMRPYLRDKNGTIFYRLTNEYKVNDIIIFPEENDLLIKRIIGIEGDIIDIDDQTGTLYVNGEKENRLGIGQTYTENNGISFPIVVGKGEVFVLGDNRSDSKDSRTFGLIRTKDIKGRVIFQWSIVKGL